MMRALRSPIRQPKRLPMHKPRQSNFGRSGRRDPAARFSICNSVSRLVSCKTLPVAVIPKRTVRSMMPCRVLSDRHILV
jgi:hypothetical protein